MGVKEETYCICGTVAVSKLCTDCINRAILDDKTRLAYINSDQEFIRDWVEYTDDLVSTDFEPTKEEWELVKNEQEDDQWHLIPTIRWINEDRSHFEDWIWERKGCGIL